MMMMVLVVVVVVVVVVVLIIIIIIIIMKMVAAICSETMTYVLNPAPRIAHMLTPLAQALTSAKSTLLCSMTQVM